jgi:hypothetical protein
MNLPAPTSPTYSPACESPILLSTAHRTHKTPQRRLTVRRLGNYSVFLLIDITPSPRFAGLQSDLAVLVAIESRADLERDQPEPLVQRVAVVGLKRPKMTKRTGKGTRCGFSFMRHFIGEALYLASLHPSSCRLALPSTIELDMAVYLSVAEQSCSQRLFW